MRKLFYLILIFSIAVSCTKPGNDDVPKLSQWSHTFQKEGGTITITTEDWLMLNLCGSEGVDYFPDYNSNIIVGPWFSVNYEQDKYMITVNVSENDTNQVREFGIGIQNGNWFGQITIKQEFH